MRILITTGLGKNDVGGPAQYALSLKTEFEKLGHRVKVAKYGTIEHSILALCHHVIWGDFILALDTFSVGFPSTLWAKVFRKKIIVRVGGDFLWSAYVNRTRESLTLPEFYKNMPKLNAKEKIILTLSKWAIRNADFLAFNTNWQRNIWQKFYGIREGRSGVVRNFIPPKREGAIPERKNFLWAGRVIPEKNPEMLNRLGVDIITGESHEKVLESIKKSYAIVSLAFTDICPNFILEGISFSKPFIMTKETGLSELFPRGGIFVDPLDEAAIEEAMEDMLDENLYNKYKEELRSVYREHSWKELAEEFIAIWNRI